MKIIYKYKNSSKRTQSVLKNIFGLTGIKAIDLLIGLILVPLSIEYLGETKYGIWLTLSSLVVWFNFFDGGLGHGLRNKFTEAIANGDRQKAKQYVSTTYFLLGCVSMLLLIVFGLLYKHINWNIILNTTDVSLNNLGFLALIVFAGFAIQLTVKLIQTLLTAYQEPAIGQLLMLFGKIGILAGLFYTMNENNSILSYGAFYTFAPILIFLVSSLILFYSKFKDFRPGLKSINMGLVSDLAKLGVNFFIIQISMAVLFATDNFIITQIFNPKEVTNYQIAHKYFAVALMLFTIIMTPIWSAITDAYIKDEKKWIQNALNKLFKLWGLLVFGIVLMLVLAKFVYKFWIGGEINIPFLTSLGWALFVILQTLNMVFTHFLNGISKLRIQLYTAISSIIINIPLSVFFAKYLYMGPAGVIFATNVSILIYIIFRSIQFKKLMNGTANGIWNK